MCVSISLFLDAFLEFGEIVSFLCNFRLFYTHNIVFWAGNNNEMRGNFLSRFRASRLLERELKCARDQYIPKLRSLNWKLQISCSHSKGGDKFFFDFQNPSAIWQTKNPLFSFVPNLNTCNIQSFHIDVCVAPLIGGLWSWYNDEMSSDSFETATCNCRQNDSKMTKFSFHEIE